MIKHRVEFEGDVFSALFTWVAGGADPVSPSIEGFVERHVAQFVPASAHRLLAQPAGTPADCGSMETTVTSSSSTPEWRLVPGVGTDYAGKGPRRHRRPEPGDPP